jgi:hypothetical protein
LGTYCETHWQPGEHIGNPLGTWWEHNKKTHWEQQKSEKNPSHCGSIVARYVKTQIMGGGGGTNLINATGLGCPMQALFQACSGGTGETGYLSMAKQRQNKIQ